MKNNVKQKKGFTLIELLVVIAIIGILSSISIVSVNTARRKARDVKRMADVSQVQLGLYLYYDDNKHFPKAEDANAAAANWISVLTPALNGTETGKLYMLRVPADPYDVDPYKYGYVSDGLNYSLSYQLEDGGVKTLTGD